MRRFHPATARPGRLVRLGVVLDTRNSPERLGEVARMCDRAGVDALWVSDDLLTSESPAQAEEPRLETWTAVRLAAIETRRARIGAMLNIDLRPPAAVAALVPPLDASSGGRLEICFAAFRGGQLWGGAPSGPAHSESRPGSPDALELDRLETYVTAVRRWLASSAAPAQDTGGTGDAPTQSPQAGDPPFGIVAWSAAAVALAARVADDIVLPASLVPDIPAAIDRARLACAAAGRLPESLGIAVALPVSIGRTSAEARARASADVLFSGVNDPARVGIFGTLEQCQRRVIELAHAGVTDLRCVVPNTPDVHDVIAQLTAMVVGTREVLRPDSPRSRDPDPPAGWGGRRPDRPA